MAAKIIIGLFIALGALAAVIVTRPDTFRVTRSAKIAAPPATIFPHVNDFRKWQAWSPWAKLDPAAKNSFEGAAAGTGAVFKWSGNNNVGEGSTTITESRPNDLIKMRLEFLRPFKGTNEVEFTFKPEGDQTLVTWTMFGKNNFISKAMSLVMDCDKMVGTQFEQGLKDMGAIAEAEAKKAKQ